VFSGFTVETQNKLGESEKQAEKLVKDASQMIVFFGEDESVKPADFFEMMHSFV